MDIDLIFVIGVAIVMLAFPSAVSAYSDRRWPKAAFMMLLIGGLSIAYAMQENPDAYSLATLPDVVVTVIGRYLG